MVSETESEFNLSTSDLETDPLLKDDKHLNDLYKEKCVSKVYTCNQTGCVKTFMRRDALDRHIYEHTGIKTFHCEINGCDKSYVTVSHYRRHLKTGHIQNKCRSKQCDKTFSSMDEMKKHYDTEHSRIKMHSCVHCGDTFRRKLQLKQHTVKHTNTYPYNCDKCGRGFINMANYDRHIQTHAEKLCPICSMPFKNWTTMVAHKKKEHSVDYKCDTCQRSFAKQITLKSHQKTHTKTEEREVFPCTYENCDKFYFEMRNLKAHIRSKHNGIKFKCTHEGCNKELTTKQKLNNHIKTHLNNPKKVIKKVDTKHFKVKPDDKRMGNQISMASLLAGVQNDVRTERMIINGEGKNIEVGMTIVPTSSEFSESDLDNKSADNQIKDPPEIPLTCS